MDGVLYNSSTLILGAVATIVWVRAQGIPHLFVTNTTSRARAQLVEKLAAFGIEAEVSQILTPAVAAADWLRSNSATGVALFVREKARVEFAGLPLLPDGRRARSELCGDRRSGRALEFPDTQPSVPAAAPQSRSGADRARDDALLAGGRGHLAGCSP